MTTTLGLRCIANIDYFKDWC